MNALFDVLVYSLPDEKPVNFQPAAPVSRLRDHTVCEAVDVQGVLRIESLSTDGWHLWALEGSSIPLLGLTLEHDHRLRALVFHLGVGDRLVVQQRDAVFPANGCYNWISVGRLATNITLAGSGLLLMLAFERRWLRPWEACFGEVEAMMKEFSGTAARKLFSVDVAADQTMVGVITTMLRNEYEGARRRMFTETKIRELVMYSFEQSRQAYPVVRGVSPDDAPRIRAAHLYLQNHLLTSVTLPSLALHVGLNTFKLKRGFRLMYGIGVMSYIRNQRLTYAYSAILNTGEKLTTIAARCGYINLSNFTAAFRRKYGHPPSQLRRRSARAVPRHLR